MVTHPNRVRNLLANTIADLLNSGAIVLMDASGNTVARLAFGSPAFGPAGSGVIVASTIARDPSAIGGTISKARFVDANGNAVLTCDASRVGDGGDITSSSSCHRKRSN